MFVWIPLVKFPRWEKRKIDSVSLLSDFLSPGSTPLVRLIHFNTSPYVDIRPVTHIK